MKAPLIIAIFAAFTMSCVSMASTQNHSSLLRQILHSDELSGYWHIGEFPERSPLVVNAPATFKADASDIEQFGKPVELTYEKPNKTSAFQIDTLTESTDAIQISFTYSPEGIRGVATFSKKNGVWELGQIELFES